MSEALPTLIPSRRQKLGRFWAVVWRTLVKYNETDGEQRAASFAYYALFALLPLTVLLITVGTRFLGSQADATNEVLKLMSQYIVVDLGAAAEVRMTVEGFMKTRFGSGLVSFSVVLWCALRFFQSLVQGVNRAWGTHEYSWWRLPLKNLLMVTILASALLLGVVTPVVLEGVRKFYVENTQALPIDFGLGSFVLDLLRSLLPPMLLFYALLLFYKFAPRRKTTMREVWLEALLVTLLLGGLQTLFVYYTGHITKFNVIYGAFGSVVALLMWIYFSGAVIILGGCACAARTEVRESLEDQAIKESE